MTMPSDVEVLDLTELQNLVGAEALVTSLSILNRQMIVGRESLQATLSNKNSSARDRTFRFAHQIVSAARLLELISLEKLASQVVDELDKGLFSQDTMLAFCDEIRKTELYLVQVVKAMKQEM